MSLFGSLMGDLDDDPIFGSHMHSHMRHMNNMMNCLFPDPFGMMAQNSLANISPRPRMPQDDLQMMSFAFPPMMSFNPGRMVANFNNMASNGDCHSFTSRSVMSMASGPDGRPHVYEETVSTTTAPGGVKETKQTVSDSRTGVKKMAIGHHIGDRAHIMEQERNYRSGEREEREEFINLDEDEADSFNHEWETRIRTYGGHAVQSRNRSDHRQLALPEPPASRHSSSGKWATSPRRSIRTPSTSKVHNSSHVSSSNTPGPTKAVSAKSTPLPAAAAAAASSSSTTVAGNRRRERTPYTKVSKKRHGVPDSHV